MTALPPNMMNAALEEVARELNLRLAARRPGQKFAQYLLAQLHSESERNNGDAQRKKVAERLKFFGLDESKGLQESVFAAGGAAIPVEYAKDMIASVRAALVLTKLGATSTMFHSEKLIGRLDGGATFYWVDEGTAVTKSTPATGAVKLKAYKGGVLCDVSNDIVRNPEVGLDDVALAQEMTSAAQVEVENQFINGASGSNKPTGLLNQMDATQKYAKAGTSVANYIADQEKLILAIDDTNRPRISRGFLMNPHLESTLITLKDGINWVFRDEMIENHSLRGFPYQVSQLVPSTAGQSPLIFGEWSDLVEGFDTNMSISTTSNARFAEDETSVKLIARVDAKLKRPKSFACIKDY